jgi:hypothetical protein
MAWVNLAPAMLLLVSKREHRRTTQVGSAAFCAMSVTSFAVDLHSGRCEIDRFCARHREEDLELVALELDMVDWWRCRPRGRCRR